MWQRRVGRNRDDHRAAARESCQFDTSRPWSRHVEDEQKFCSIVLTAQSLFRFLRLTAYSDA
jgi:hypothetical protein